MMKQRITAIFKKIFITIIILIANFYFFALIFRPEKRLIEHISVLLKDRAGILLDYSDVKLIFPGKIIIVDPLLKQDGKQVLATESIKGERVIFNGERLSVSIAFRTLFLGKAGLNLKSNAYGGAINGVIKTALSTRPQPLELIVNWDDIDLSYLLEDYPDFLISSGNFQGKAELIADFNQDFIYKGPVHITIDKTHFNLPDKFKNYLEILEFNTIKADFVMNHSEIQVQKIELVQSDTMVQILGTINQRMPVSDSVVDFQVRLYMLDEKQSFNTDVYIPLTLKGKINHPDVYFLGQKL